MSVSLRYVYARPRSGRRGRLAAASSSSRAPKRRAGASAWECAEVSADLVRASAFLTPAARAAGEAAPWPVGASFAGLADEDVASIFAAAQRGEVTLSGGRYTREPTLWAFVRDPRIARRR